MVKVTVGQPILSTPLAADVQTLRASAVALVALHCALRIEVHVVAGTLVSRVGYHGDVAARDRCAAKTQAL